MKTRLALIVLGIGLAAIASIYGWGNYRSSSYPQWREVPTPVLPQGPIVLRVGYAVDPRLPRLSPEQLEQLLTTANTTVERFFGLHVSFGPIQTLEISDLFKAMPSNAWREFKTAIHSATDGASGLELMRQSTYDGLRSGGVTPDLVREFAQPHLRPDTLNGDLTAISSALVSRHLTGLARWRTLRAADGSPIIGDKPYSEWMAWVALGYGSLPFDVGLTNELVASAEYEGNSIHTMLRGGVSIGTTFYSKTSPFQAYVMFSTFMFSDELPQAVAIRDEGHYSATEAATLAGTYLAHEFGHLLLRLGHPYGNEACAMRPVVMFQFRSWSDKLDPSRCPVGSEPQMNIGATRIHYDKRFAR